jgi:hypothetical protein
MLDQINDELNVVLMNIFRQVLSALGVIALLATGGCSTIGHELQNQARLPSGRYIHIPLVSTYEESMLREATERATALHSQLRAFDVANKAVESKIRQLRFDPQARQVGKKSNRAKHNFDVMLTKSNLLEVRFAKGSSDLDQGIQDVLSKALSSGTFLPNSPEGSEQAHLVLQVATHKRVGLDSITARRLGNIHEFLKANKVPADAVKLKVVRVIDSGIPSKVDGSASRIIRVSALRLDPLKL